MKCIFMRIQWMRTTLALSSFCFCTLIATQVICPVTSTHVYSANEKEPMNKMLQSTASEPSGSAPLPAPQGIGMAVAFDWGLAVQLLFMPFVPLFTRSHGLLPQIGSNTLLSVLLSLLISLPFAALLAIFGEGVRWGWRWTRPIQLVANALLSVVGLIGLWSLESGLQAGDYWGLVTSVILVIFSPLITWRLSRPVTREWFRRVTSTQARQRHGGSWPWLIAIWAIVGGVLQALAASLK